MRRILLLTTAILTLGGAGAALADQGGAAAGRAGQATAQPQAPGTAGGMPGDMAALQGLLGRTVTGSDGRSLGTLSDIVLDQETERANVAVIDTGAADGTGDKLIAVDYTLLDVAGDTVTARTVTRDQVAAMPAFEYGENMVSLGDKGGAKRAQ
ncbi:PRC-barrel domain-containing protein [Azospirillum sp. ST 5-10]|uniref:PRC-barrel domain-containing protein n=1 Tax=unclassified Azospirillum TaxID=2630922 RepID=UPI003F4A4ED3